MQRPRPLHRVHRLRVDVEHRRQQPAPQRDLPRRRRRRRARSSRTPTITPLGSDNPRDLWKWMDAYEEKTGGSVLAIAHNGNLSNGRMFPLVEAFGRQAVDRDVRRDAREVGAALRGDADQGRRRGPSVPVAERRVRRLRALGQGQPRRQRREDEGDARVRVRALGAQERPRARAEARHQSLQVRHGRQQRRAHRRSPRWRRTTSSARRRRRSRARSASTRAVHRQREDRREDHGLGGRRLRLRRGLGDGEHARGDLGRDAAPGDLRDDGLAHGRALLRRLGLRADDAHDREPGGVGYAKGVPMGGDLRAAPAGKAPTFLVAALKDPIGAQPRPHPDRQGLARREGRAARAGLRRRVVAATASPARTASCRRSATPSTSRTRPGPTRSARPS